MSKQKSSPYIVELNDGNRMPMLGLGTWQARGQQVKDAVKEAIYYGYRHIDTATIYKNEREIGDAIEECIHDEEVKREELFITSKLWNDSHQKSAVPQALNDSLRALKLDYLDMYLIHWPMGSDYEIDYLETWEGMEKCKDQNYTKSIGVSNFNHKQIERLLEDCQVVPAVNQVECHPYLAQKKLIRFCHSKSIHVVCYSPFGSGHKDQERDGLMFLDDPVVKSIAKAHNCHPAHVLLRYSLQRQLVVIPKAATVSHIRSNLEALQSELTKDDMARLDDLDRNMRLVKFDRFSKHPHYPFNIDY